MLGRDRKQTPPGAGQSAFRPWDCCAALMAWIGGWLILVALVVHTTLALRGLLWLAVVVVFGGAVLVLRKSASKTEAADTSEDDQTGTSSNPDE